MLGIINHIMRCEYIHYYLFCFHLKKLLLRDIIYALGVGNKEHPTPQYHNFSSLKLESHKWNSS